MMPQRIEPPEYIAIQESLAPFYEDITDEQRDRRKFDEQRVEEVNIYTERIEEKLNEEILQRKAADSALDKLAQTRLDTVQEALVVQMQVRSRGCLSQPIPVRAAVLAGP
jgi:predicted outer membrane protein